MKKHLLTLLLYFVISPFNNNIYGQDISVTGSWALSSVGVNEIIVGSIENNAVDYDKVKNTVSGVFNAITFKKDSRCGLTIDQKEVTGTYTYAGNTLTITIDNKKTIYQLSADGSNVMTLKTDFVFDNITKSEIGYRVTMVLRKQN
ncbi:MAG: hypothetical protein LBG19_01670 [Prevotellaceae bacterium]|jgi:hypothetical protein|nr:hypothetical protein [Prevotellaceae bacterium]